MGSPGPLGVRRGLVRTGTRRCCLSRLLRPSPRQSPAGWLLGRAWLHVAAYLEQGGELGGSILGAAHTVGWLLYREPMTQECAEQAERGSLHWALNELNWGPLHSSVADRWEKSS